MFVNDDPLNKGECFRLAPNQRSQIRVRHFVPMYESVHGLDILLACDETPIKVQSKVQVQEQLSVRPRNLPLVTDLASGIATSRSALVTYRSQSPRKVALELDAVSHSLIRFEIADPPGGSLLENEGIYSSRWRISFGVKNNGNPGRLNARVLDAQTLEELGSVNVPFYFQWLE